jgi:hypothetical protein
MWTMDTESKNRRTRAQCGHRIDFRSQSAQRASDFSLIMEKCSCLSDLSTLQVCTQASRTAEMAMKRRSDLENCAASELPGHVDWPRSAMPVHTFTFPMEKFSFPTENFNLTTDKLSLPPEKSSLIHIFSHAGVRYMALRIVRVLTGMTYRYSAQC